MDYQNPDYLNPNSSNFDDTDVDGLGNDGQLFWAINTWIVNSWITFDKKVGCYLKNKCQLVNNFLNSEIMSLQIIDTKHQDASLLGADMRRSAE